MTPDRREFLQSVAALPGIAALPGTGAPRAERDVYKELGVRTLINAAGTYTYLSASRMPREVTEAMESASRHFVNLSELHQAVGRRISALVGCEAALVTAGAASALTLGTAAAIAGKDPQKIVRLPDTEGMKNEVLVPKSHRNGYDHAVRNAGARLVEVETVEEAERAANAKTAMLLYFNVHGPTGKIKADEFATLGKKLGVPSLVDAAADVPPAENYSRFLKMGYDLAVFSGGKGLRGPQCSGLLLGRKDLIEAAAKNNNPNTDAIGRTNKVGKEEIVGVWAALEHFLKQDPKGQWAEWERRCRAIAESASSVRGVKTGIFVPEIANAVPHLRVTWDSAALGLKPADAARLLQQGDPRIEVRPVTGEALEIAVWMLEADEVGVVADRLRQALAQK